jgi:hypothetical protein
MAFIACPHCQTLVNHDPAQEGLVATCPACQRTFPMPAAADRSELAFDKDEVGHRRQPEPWYYAFLEGYAKAFLVLGVMGALFGLALALGVVFFSATGRLMALAVVVGLVFSLLGVLFVFALIQLAVEVGRNLRAVRRFLERRD